MQRGMIDRIVERREMKKYWDPAFLDRAEKKEGERSIKNGWDEGLDKGYRKTLEYLFGLQRFGIKLGLTNITTLLRHLGNPHEGCRRAYRRLQRQRLYGRLFDFHAPASGIQGGTVYVSHLVDFSERIRVQGVPIAWKNSPVHGVYPGSDR